MLSTHLAEYSLVQAGAAASLVAWERSVDQVVWSSM